jgi:hypothetical protein
MIRRFGTDNPIRLLDMNVLKHIFTLVAGEEHSGIFPLVVYNPAAHQPMITYQRNLYSKILDDSATFEETNTAAVGQAQFAKLIGSGPGASFSFGGGSTQFGVAKAKPTVAPAGAFGAHPQPLFRTKQTAREAIGVPMKLDPPATEGKIDPDIDFSD